MGLSSPEDRPFFFWWLRGDAMKALRPKLLLLGFGFLLATATSLWGQVGTITGELHLARGDFPGRVLVELQLRGAPIASEYCDEQGKFSFSSLSNNPYHIIIRDERFYPVDQLVIIDLSITSTSFAQINLTPRQQVQKDSLSGRQGGGNPFIVDPEEYRRHFPKNALKEFDRGVEADRKGKRDDAIKHYEKALSLAPTFYPAHNNLGSDYLGKSDFAAAKAQFEQAIKLNQSDAQAHLNLANLYLATKDYAQGYASVQEGLRRQPNSALGKFLLGSIYERMGRPADAERALHEALQLDPKMSRVHLELVNLYLSQQKKAEASTELRAFLKDSPNDPLAAKARELLTKLETEQ